MNKTKENKKYQVGILIILIAAILFYLLNMYTPLSFKDDFVYSFSYATGERMGSLKEVIASQIEHYRVKNGRFVVHTLLQLLLTYDKAVFNIVNTVMFLLFICLVCYHGIGKNPVRHPGKLLCTFAAFFLLTPMFAENFLWVSGACNYLFGFFAVLIYLFPYRYKLEHTGAGKNKCMGLLKFVGMSVLGIIAGNTMENGGIALLATIVGYLIIYRIRGIKYSAWMFAPGVVVGLLVLLFAPGEMRRVSNDGSLMLITMVSSFIKTSIAFVVHFYPIIIIVIIIICLYAKKKEQYCHEGDENKLRYRMKTWSIAEVYFCGMLAAMYSLVVVPGGIGIYSRIWFGPMTFLIIAVLASANAAERYISAEMKNVQTPVLIALAIITVAVVGQGIINVRNRYTENNIRVGMIKHQTEIGEKTIHIPAMNSSSTFSIYFCNSEHLFYDKEKNEIIAKYYNVPEVVRDDSIELK